MIDRLRTWARNGHIPKALADDLEDAADEIERLRVEIQWLRAALQRIVDNGESGFSYGVAFAAIRALEDKPVLKYTDKDLHDTEVATIERCARVADKYKSDPICENLAAAIRALKDN